jgi:hypothetical protein
MSAMSELDLVLREYEGARNAMVSTSGTTIVGHLQAAENVIRAADVLANFLRSQMAANAERVPPPKGPVNYMNRGG